MKTIKIKITNGRRYLFKPSTKAIEFLNGILLTFFGLVILVNDGALLNTKFYLMFKYAGPTWIWSIVLLLGIIQLVVMQRDTLESNLVSTIVLKLSALAWFLIAIMFGSDYPPLSTAFFTYMSMSLITVLAAYELSEQNIMELLIREDNRDD